MTARPESMGEHRGREPKEKKIVQSSEKQVVSIENPVIRESLFDLELSVKYYEPLVDALGPEIARLESCMQEAGIPLSELQKGRQLQVLNRTKVRFGQLEKNVVLWNTEVDDQLPGEMIDPNTFQVVGQQIKEISIQLNVANPDSQAKALEAVIIKLDQVELALREKGIQKTIPRVTRSYTTELKEVASYLLDLEEQMTTLSGSLDVQHALQRCQQLTKMTNLLLARIGYLETKKQISVLTSQIKDIEYWLPNVKKMNTRKKTLEKVTKKHQELRVLREQRESVPTLTVEEFSQQISALMLELEMSFAPMGFPDGLGTMPDGVGPRLHFPLDERVKTTYGRDLSEKFNKEFIIISVYSRKPNGAQGRHLYERFFNDVSEFAMARELFLALSTDPQNQDMLFRMVDYAPNNEEISNRKIAQGLILLASGETSTESVSKERKKRNKNRKPNKSQKNKRGPGRYSGHNRSKSR